MAPVPLPAAALAGVALVWALMKLKKSSKAKETSPETKLANGTAPLDTATIKQPVVMIPEPEATSPVKIDSSRDKSDAVVVATSVNSTKQAANGFKAEAPVIPAEDASIKARKMEPIMPPPDSPPSEMSSALPSKSYASSEVTESIPSRSASGTEVIQRTNSLKRLGSKMRAQLKKLSITKRVE